MKNYHSVRYYEKRLYKLQMAADSIGYNIDGNGAYKAACGLLPLTGKDIPGAFFGAFVAACEAVEMARREAATC